jgi:hypothetical protein
LPLLQLPSSLILFDWITLPLIAPFDSHLVGNLLQCLSSSADFYCSNRQIDDDESSSSSLQQSKSSNRFCWLSEMNSENNIHLPSKQHSNYK